MKRKISFRGFRLNRKRLPEGEKIDRFFRERLDRWLLDSVDCQMKEKNFYPALYLMLITVEVLSGFMEGGKPGVDTFCAFVSKYFGAIFSSRVPNPLYRSGLVDRKLSGKKELTFSEMLWAFFRCGFADACTVYPGASLTARSRYYFRYYNRIGLRMDIGRFHRDFVRACRAYRSDVVSDYLVRQKFIRRFNQVFPKKGVKS